MEFPQGQEKVAAVERWPLWRFDCNKKKKKKKKKKKQKKNYRLKPLTTFPGKKKRLKCVS